MRNFRKKLTDSILVVGLLFSASVFTGSAEETIGMVLDLGDVSDLVQVTPEYSNAVMSVVLPYFSDAAKKLNLPVSQPLTYASIAKVSFLPFPNKTLRNPHVSVLLKNDWAFDFFEGHVRRIENLHSYASLQDPGKIADYYGAVRMTQAEAIQMARDALTKLGIPLEDVFAEQVPHIAPPFQIGTNIVPHYEIQWLNPRINSQIIGEDNPKTRKTALVVFPAVDIHINAKARQIESIYVANKLPDPAPLAKVTPIHAPLDWPSVNPEYARQLIPIMFKAIDEYAEKLSLPIPRPLTTNNVGRVEIHDNIGWPHAEIWTTNGWHFIYRHTMVNGHYAPDNLFASNDRKIHLKEFEGKWNLTTNQAIGIVRQAMKKLDYPTNNIHMDFAPNIYTTEVDKENIPRVRFEWYYEVNNDLQSRLEAEVNADTGKLESLYYDDKAYWGSRPPIDVPISFKGNGHN